MAVEVQQQPVLAWRQLQRLGAEKEDLGALVEPQAGPWHHRRVRVDEAQQIARRAEADRIPVAQDVGAADRLAVHEGAVGAPGVVQGVARPLAGDAGVQARDSLPTHDDVATGRAAHGVHLPAQYELCGRNVRAQRDQPRRRDLFVLAHSLIVPHGHPFALQPALQPTTQFPPSHLSFASSLSRLRAFAFVF